MITIGALDMVDSGALEAWLIVSILVSILGGAALGYFLATSAPRTRLRLIATVITLVILAMIGGGIFGYFNWANRYRWPRHRVPDQQDIPPLDKSSWPKSPVIWTAETVAVQVATPDGLKQTNITYAINSLGMKFVRIEPGTFWEGLTKEQALRMNGEKKFGHQVTLTKSFYMQAHEVTLGLFEQYDPTFAKRRELFQRGKGFENHPALGVRWQECQQFCRWLSQKEGRLYRLPTEAEWEYACKAGTSTILYWGDDAWDRRKCNVGGIRQAPESYAEDGYMYTSPVGIYPPNPWGLYDMIGNAWEWVNDWFDWFPSEPQTDPQGPSSGHMRVDKGSGWDTRTRQIKSCARDGNNPADLFEKRGFRVLCEVAE